MREGGRWEWRRGCGGERERRLSSCLRRRGRPHGRGGCSHRLGAQVLGGAVVNFLVNLSKKITSVDETTQACSHVRTTKCAPPVTETVQRRFTTNSIIVMGRGRSTFHTCYPTSPFGSHGPVSVRATSSFLRYNVLSGNIMLYCVRRPACFLEA